ncbi:MULTISPECIES: Mor transcription activator family protein [Acinetobacter]|uniref:Mor transcription activator family protein n=1 Tax=Acinetobacter corruptisaponis TaxID=3045147 RepID=A0ABY8S322_9GAMM|nr:Mor transcription activator family protein [Acinetobacter sp. KCTC 92772]WHP05776.1 Mor transcription activator family protein [Acinetobacter sp. KCTC 92772]
MSHSHVFQKVIDLIGVHAAIRLVRLKGGQDITFPLVGNLHYLHWLVVEVGMDNAITMCKEFRGESLKLPIEVNALLQLRNQAIADEFTAGESISSIAKRYGVDRKLVQTILDKSGLREATPADANNNQIDWVNGP